MKKKLLAFGLCAMMLAGLTACGGSTNADKGTAETQKAAYVYVPEYFSWDVEEPENGYVQTYGILNGCMLATSSEWGDEGGAKQEIIKYNLLDSTTQRIPFATTDSNENINAVTLMDDGAVLVCTQNYMWDEISQNGKSTYQVYVVDAAGQVATSIDLTEICDAVQEANGSDYIYVNAIASDADGNIYLAFEQQVVVIDQNGTKLFEISMDNWIQGIGNMGNGSVYMTYYGQNNYEIAVIDKDAKAIGKKYEMTGNGLNGFFDVTEDNKLYYTDGDSIRMMNLETEENEKILSWLDADINGQYVEGISCQDEDTFVAYYRDWGTDEEGFVRLVKTDSSLVKEKEIITLAALTSDSNMQRDIINFNKNNTEYRIQLKIYLDYSTMSDADWENYEQFSSDAATRMINDITGNNPPDIICFSNTSSDLNLNTLAEKGVVEELTPYLEAAGYKLDDFVDGVVNSYKVNDKVYTLPGRFAVQTLLADSAIVGDKEGWTLEEALEIIKNLPEGMSYSEYDTQNNFLSTCLAFGYENFIDEANATCNFDSDDFKSILEIAKTFPKEYDYTVERPSAPILIQNGEILVISSYISSLEEIQVSQAYFGDKTPTYIGYPGVGGNGSLLTGLQGTYAICSKSEHKDAVAEFVLSQITKPYDKEDWQSYGFPSLKSELDKYITETITVRYITDENGDPILDADGNPIPEGGGGGFGWGDWSYDYRQSTQEDADELMHLLDDIQTLSLSTNNTIFQMIYEEAEFYFNGQKSLDEVASIIQNRVGLYLMENN